jgi:DNA polymerase-3 subunit epsilon/CBS domain-containing protein
MAVLDLETTGLDVRRDRIVQIGAVVMLGSEILKSPRIDLMVNPGVPIPPVSTHIHGLGDADVAAAESFANCAKPLQELLLGRIVIGHHIGFDLAVLRHEAARTGVPWHDPFSLDLALLVGALQPALPDLGLENICEWLGVDVSGRHTALGDSLTTARAVAQLWPRLLNADVRTLAEADALASRRADLRERQVHAGWHAMPGNVEPARPIQPITRLDSHVYSRRLEDLMHAPPITVEPAASIHDAAQTMTRRGVGALLILDPDQTPAGILTERDVLRVVSTSDTDLATVTVADVMSAPVETMHRDEMLYRGLGRMMRTGNRHICVVDATGAAVGIVSQRDLVQHRAASANALGDALAEAKDAMALAAAHGQLPGVAAALVADGLGGLEVSRVVSNEVRALTARAAALSVARLKSEGRGDAPASWCVMVLGSGGRGESLLSADQDSALIHAGATDDDAWYASMAESMTQLIAAAGLPLCDGGVMASNPLWRGTVDQWRGRIDDWLVCARPNDLLNVDIFFDMSAVAGEATLGVDLHRSAVTAAAQQPTFLALLADSVVRMSSPLRPFGRFRTEAGRVELKRCGLLPLVNIARVMALQIGSVAHSTPDRLREVAASGRMATVDVERLLGIHWRLLTLILNQQLDDLQAGIRPSSRVALNALDRPTRKRLRIDLKRLEEILTVARSTLSA